MTEIKTTGTIVPIDLIRKSAVEFSRIEGSCMYTHLSSESFLEQDFFNNRLFKIDGSLFMILTSGHIKVKFNSSDYDAVAPAMISMPHGSLVQFELGENPDFEGYALAFTPEFLQEVNISFTTITRQAIVGRESPIMLIMDREMPIFLRYFSLIHSVLKDEYNIQINRHIVANLTAALFYQTILMVYKHMDVVKDKEASVGPRRSGYVHDFMKLVHRYYTTERSVSFYAEKLYISPKYLSMLVKEATGRSAARWIDHFVITEAKNLLRYSGKNIQQVAYALNFSNQSSFGKYFKHLTGMSPTEYQKS